MKEFYAVVGKKDHFFIHGTFFDGIIEVAKKTVRIPFVVIKYTFNGFHTVEEIVFDSEKQD